jgi:hypothetical protein
MSPISEDLLLAGNAERVFGGLTTVSSSIAISGLHDKATILINVVLG